MSRRLISPFCVVVLSTWLLTLQSASAGTADVWLDWSCIPVVYWQSLPKSTTTLGKPQVAKQKLAQPTVAPPSPIPSVAPLEKKLEKKPAVAESAKPIAVGNQHGPAVREEGPFFDTYSIAPKNDLKPPDDQCTVTFTNLSERPIKLTIANQERTLATSESVMVPVKRQFTWRMEGREPQNELVRTGEYAIQIVIRR